MRRREVAFTSAGVQLRGTLALPPGDGPFPGLVTVHGASHGGRDFRLFTHLESLLVPAGFAILRYDRPGSDSSGGDFESADFAQLAADALAALGVLADDAAVDPARLGIFGFSQGGWIGPEAAVRSPLVSFLVLVGACGVTPAAQMQYAAATAIRASGHPEAAVELAVALRASVDDAMRGRLPRAEAARRVREAQAEPWFGQAFVHEPPPEPGPQDEKWRLEMDYDIGPVLRELRLPVLLIHGSHDRWTPIDDSRAAWQAAFAERAELLSAVRIAGTGHYPTLAGGAEGEEAAPISPDYEALLLRWLRERAAREPAF
ncbi:MAG TPA: alpha/beta hydrolase [Candidatus Limnocylindria bacterium]|nr:alpha/beta hydrolase [Candidatus Limnocylindria bacterium]